MSRLILVVVCAGLVWARAPSAGAVAGRASTLPAQLTGREFWQFIDGMSETNGFFQSDNLVSNEDTFQNVIPELVRTVPSGGVYLGVGPDQNFTYIVATRPRLAFITDIRRGNLQEHLMYKALIELSADRAEFLSRLFSRRRPDGLGPKSAAADLFDAFDTVAPSRVLYDENRRDMLALLGRLRGSPLETDDVAGIERVYQRFFEAGPNLSYAAGAAGGGIVRMPRYPTYEQLQLATDEQGVARGYLATENNFQILRTFETENRLVPLVGDFAGPKALRSVGRYLADHQATVSVFYTSNVEQYLFQNGVWPAFARNVSTMPLDETSTFIRSCFNFCSAPAGPRAVSLLDSIPGLLREFHEGRIQDYWQVLQHSR